jgi:hypothetical protein
MGIRNVFFERITCALLMKADGEDAILLAVNQLHQPKWRPTSSFGISHYSA